MGYIQEGDLCVTYNKSGSGTHIQAKEGLAEIVRKHGTATFGIACPKVRWEHYTIQG